jgi:hypothetical protein
MLFTREMLAATKKAICMPETVGDEYNVEVAGRVADTPIHDGLGQGNRHANLSEFWHSVYWVGPTNGGCLSERKLDIGQMAGLSGAGRF